VDYGVVSWLVEGKGGEVLWRRVLITSRGCTARVDIVPAERPPMASMTAGESCECLSAIREEVERFGHGGSFLGKLKGG